MFSRRITALPKALALATAAVAVTLAAPAAQAAPARSATAVVVGQKLFYTAAAGQTNHLSISWALGAFDPDSQLSDFIYTFDDTVRISSARAASARPAATTPRPSAR